MLYLWSNCSGRRLRCGCFLVVARTPTCAIVCVYVCVCVFVCVYVYVCVCMCVCVCVYDQYGETSIQLLLPLHTGVCQRDTCLGYTCDEQIQRSYGGANFTCYFLEVSQCDCTGCTWY